MGWDHVPEDAERRQIVGFSVSPMAVFDEDGVTSLVGIEFVDENDQLVICTITLETATAVVEAMIEAINDAEHPMT